MLAYAAEEAERLSHRHIGTEHLLLGLLREEEGFAASVLRECGLDLDKTRESIASSARGVVARPEVTFGATRGRQVSIIEFISGNDPIAYASYSGAPTPRIGDEVELRNQKGEHVSYRVVNVTFFYDELSTQGVPSHELARVIVELTRE